MATAQIVHRQRSSGISQNELEDLTTNIVVIQNTAQNIFYASTKHLEELMRENPSLSPTSLNPLYLVYPLDTKSGYTHKCYHPYSKTTGSLIHSEEVVDEYSLDKMDAYFLNRVSDLVSCLFKSTTNDINYHVDVQMVKVDSDEVVKRVNSLFVAIYKAALSGPVDEPLDWWDGSATDDPQMTHILGHTPENRYQWELRKAPLLEENSSTAEISKKALIAISEKHSGIIKHTAMGILVKCESLLETIFTHPITFTFFLHTRIKASHPCFTNYFINIGNICWPKAEHERTVRHSLNYADDAYKELTDFALEPVLSEANNNFLIHVASELSLLFQEKMTKQPGQRFQVELQPYTIRFMEGYEWFFFPKYKELQVPSIQVVLDKVSTNLPYCAPLQLTIQSPKTWDDNQVYTLFTTSTIPNTRVEGHDPHKWAWL